MRRRSSATRAAACTRASSPSSSRRATTASRSSWRRPRREPPLIVVLDGIEDPHNIGAVLRSVDAAGAHGVVRQARHAAPLDGVAMKASAGAAAAVRVATVVNIARAVEELKDAGVWTVGLAGEATERYDDVDLTVPTAIVVGAEGSGLRRLVRERCDRLVSIPMRGLGRQPECLGGCWGYAVRGPTAEAAARRDREDDSPGKRLWLAPVACRVLQLLFCLGWRSSVR